VNERQKKDWTTDGHGFEKRRRTSNIQLPTPKVEF